MLVGTVLIFCCSLQPPGSGNRLPEVCCVVSTFASFTFYRQVKILLILGEERVWTHVVLWRKSLTCEFPWHKKKVSCLVDWVDVWSRWKGCVVPFVSQLVEKMEKKRWESMENCKSLFKSGYGRPLPDPGKEAWIRCHSVSSREKLEIPLDHHWLQFFCFIWKHSAHCVKLFWRENEK